MCETPFSATHRNCIRASALHVLVVHVQPLLDAFPLNGIARAGICPDKVFVASEKLPGMLTRAGWC